MRTSISDRSGTAVPADSAARIEAEARAVGFDAVGIADPASLGDAGHRFKEFIAQQRHGDMGWLVAKADRRVDPCVLWPEVGAIVMLGLNYGPATDPLAALQQRERGVISVYAQGRDYHDVVKARLKRLGRWIGETFACDIKVFVDTAPVLEKPLAGQAGLGWQGKHTNLVSRDFGSWLFLGAIYTTLSLPAGTAHGDSCGSCRRCLDVCPTAAFPAPYQLDARRCISYLTIEHKGHIAREFRAPMGNRIFGCDDCLAVCPWNKYAQRAHEAAFFPRVELAAPLLRDLVYLDDAGFRRVFAGSPVKRLGRNRFIRNVLIAIGNSAEPALATAAEAQLNDASPLVRAMAIWATSQLLAPPAFAALRSRYLPTENDAEVRAEWG